MAASGRIVTAPLEAADALNASALPSAETAYRLMVQILQDGEGPLIFGSLALSASAIVQGLSRYTAVVQAQPGSGRGHASGD